MKLYICNPHTVIGKTAFSSLFKTRHYAKYDFLLDLLRKPYNAGIYIDGTTSSLTGGSEIFPFISDNYWVMRVLSFFEIYLWCYLNKINPFKQKIIFTKRNLDEKNDVLFGFAFLTDTFINPHIEKHSIYRIFKGKKILHATHYFSRIETISKRLKETGVTTMTAEADITTNSFFKLYFPFIKKVIVLPGVLQERFKNKKDFKTRINKCFVTGNIFKLIKTIPGNKSYYTFFKTESLHIMRNLIYKNQNNLKSIIDSKISILNDHNKFKGKYKNVTKLFMQIVKPYSNLYYSLNIVDEYNKYKMFLVPEESIGFPAVSFIEGMACGCAFIGLNHAMYTDLGLKDKVHYVAYNGTLKDLKEKIQYYQTHTVELEKIAKNGELFVKKRFKKEIILKEFYENLQKLS